MLTNSLFVDTSGWASLLIPGEQFAQQAVQQYRSAYTNAAVTIYTSDHVVAELVVLATARHVPRSRMLHDVNAILLDSRLDVLYTDKATLLEAWDLLKRRPDKEWSLVDAISLVWMRRQGIIEALTSDHHFEQAGFVRLLK